MQQYVDHYNHVRLHSAIGYLTPADKLLGLEEVIFAERDRKLEDARQRVGDRPADHLAAEPIDDYRQVYPNETADKRRR